MQVGVKVLPLACCAVEIGAATEQFLPFMAEDLQLTEYAAGQTYDAVILMVAGTVTKASAPTIKAIWDELDGPKYAVAYGVCASSGGPYWDSYAVVPGAGEFLPISIHIPGCPPSAATLIPALQKLLLGPSHG